MDLGKSIYLSCDEQVEVKITVVKGAVKGVVKMIKNMRGCYFNRLGRSQLSGQVTGCCPLNLHAFPCTTNIQRLTR